MTPEADMSNRIEWVRDPARLAQMADPALAPIAPFSSSICRPAPRATCRNRARPS